MKANQLYFHIHYCNSRLAGDPLKPHLSLARTLTHHELILVLNGTGAFTIGKKKYTAEKGVLFYLPAEVQHTLKSSSQEPFYFLSVHFSYAKLNVHEGSWTVSEGSEMLSPQFAHKLKDYYQLEDLFRRMIDCWKAKLPGYEFAAKTMLQQLLIAISQNLRKQTQNYSTSLKIEKVMHYIQQHIEHKIALRDLAELVQLSPTYLSRSFKTITGYSIIEFVNRMKIEQAKTMLLEGDRKIKDVAQTLGFTDEFYFSRIFKKLEGISPSEYYSKNVHVI